LSFLRWMRKSVKRFSARIPLWLRDLNVNPRLYSRNPSATRAEAATLLYGASLR
jgi:hypothetical protein